ILAVDVVIVGAAVPVVTVMHPPFRGVVAVMTIIMATVRRRSVVFSALMETAICPTAMDSIAAASTVAVQIAAVAIVIPEFLYRIESH
ncbi:MAG TPA: hypothetical protein VJZ27_03280, partial [Aggregatilineales bacterium]|nr:hypothetical protein [Aggregatilineales bacterium]